MFWLMGCRYSDWQAVDAWADEITKELRRGTRHDGATERADGIEGGRPAAERSVLDDEEGADA
jgi:hypothetical protein